MNQFAQKISQYPDTFANRLELGFPGAKEDWMGSEATFCPEGKSLTIMGHSVMESWEEPYMQHLARLAARNKGRVLEVGFGLGLSAKYIQEKQPAEHVIIEANRHVYDRAILFAESASHKVTPIHGLWEEVTSTLKAESFDGILFDTYPLKSEEIHCNHFPFFPEAFRLLKKGGILTYYSDEVSMFSDHHLTMLSEAGFRNISFESSPVSPPKDCVYWKAGTILAPIIIK